MIVVLLMIFAVLLGASLHYVDKLGDCYCYHCNYKGENKRNSIRAMKSFYRTLVIYLALMSAVYTIFISASYDSYVDCRTFLDATMEQYEGAISLYEQHGVINLSKAASMALTDHKYEGYQDNMADFVTSLRNNVTKYNEAIVSKRIMGNNLFFSWFIIQPDDDMKVLKICKD